MTSFEILKQANDIVAGLIKAKTPPLFDTCRAAYVDLGDLVAYAKASDDEVTKEFAEGVSALISRLDALRSSVVPNKTVEKKMEAPELVAYVKTQVEKALTEETAPALRRLHALKAAIAKASSFFSGGEGAIPIEMYTDPFQQATAEVGEDGKDITSGAAQVGEVSGVAGMSVTDVFKGMVANVEKAAREAKEIDSGWSVDLNSPEFLHGRRAVDFGRDGSK
jgi:hypothetical protein